MRLRGTPWTVRPWLTISLFATLACGEQDNPTAHLGNTTGKTSSAQEPQSDGSDDTKSQHDADDTVSDGSGSESGDEAKPSSPQTDSAEKSAQQTGGVGSQPDDEPDEPDDEPDEKGNNTGGTTERDLSADTSTADPNGTQVGGKPSSSPTDAGLPSDPENDVDPADEPWDAGPADSTQHTPPYDIREGPFKLLVYSRTNGYRSSDSIRTGQRMLSEIGAEVDFEPVFMQTNEHFTTEGLAQYEAVFFLNTSGDVLGPAEEAAFEAWMYDGGAFLGTNRATDTELDWEFYKELTGQFYDGHGPCCVELDIQWTPEGANFPGVDAMPSPWTFKSMWFYFNRFREWSEKPGFQILATVEYQDKVLPVSFTRDFNNFRSFYAAMGHQPATFDDPQMKQFITGAILWSVRRSGSFY